MQYIWLIELIIIIISVLVNVIQGLMLKHYRNKQIRLMNQKMLNFEIYKKKLEKKKGVYDEKAKKAKNSNDILDIIGDIMSDDDYNPQ